MNDSLGFENVHAWHLGNNATLLAYFPVSFHPPYCASRKKRHQLFRTRLPLSCALLAPLAPAELGSSRTGVVGNVISRQNNVLEKCALGLLGKLLIIFFASSSQSSSVSSTEKLNLNLQFTSRGFTVTLRLPTRHTVMLLSFAPL